MSRKLKDQEILGLDTDGNIIQWDANTRQRFNCGETPEQFGADNIEPFERKRIEHDQKVKP